MFILRVAILKVVAFIVYVGGFMYFPSQMRLAQIAAEAVSEAILAQIPDKYAVLMKVFGFEEIILFILICIVLAWLAMLMKKLLFIKA